jgi:hypothetical protein
MKTCEIKWISSKKEVPKKRGKYLAACKGFRGPVIRYYNEGWGSLQPVTHWAYLPPMPYEMEDDDEDT